MTTGIVLSERSWQRLRPLIEERGEVVYDPGTLPQANWQHVRVTAAALDCAGSGSGGGSGGGLGIRYYPAVVELWDAQEEAATDLGACLILERHDYPLVIGNVYAAKQAGNLTVCGTAYSLFVTAIGVAGLDSDLNGSGSGTGLESGASAANGCDTSGVGAAGEGITIPFAACDADGNPCTKELVITSPYPLSFCITDPNGCGG